MLYSLVLLLPLVLATPLNNTIRADEAVVQCDGGEPMCCNAFDCLNAVSGSSSTGTFGFIGQALNGQGGVQCIAVGVQGGALSSTCKNANACCGQTGQAGSGSFSCTPVNII
ncbi:hypothetical protein EXIGLDRAFT_756969 [Exidia glandulosa HHB12029]|uniref:Hydrophobin n=1 Tax=Exidia glandulosa HHB12029 TaxID=1314781 RepID=A0A165AVF0_EXIGL|nr:hypothetical protein EXIGLDRAFT_756969 [Exidia glandulosa HHB12029]